MVRLVTILRCAESAGPKPPAKRIGGQENLVAHPKTNERSNMSSLNKAFLIGNLTRDPEVRVTPKGTSLGQFGLAVNRKWKDESGAQKEEVTFVDIEVWGKTAELALKYLIKGDLAMVEGRLKLDQWEDKTTGQKRSRLKVVAENIQFLKTSGKQGGQQQSSDDPPADADAPY